MQQEGFIYVYRIQTPSEVIIKVGHGMTHPKMRMDDYCSTYGLDVVADSLRYWPVVDSVKVERQIFKMLEKSGYRNIKEGNSGPQELFQAPRQTLYSNVVKQIENGLNDFNRAKTYLASDLIGVKYPPKKPVVNQSTSAVKHELGKPTKLDVKPKDHNYLLIVIALISLALLLGLIALNIDAIKDFLSQVFNFIKGFFILWVISLFAGKKRRRKRFW